MIDKITLFMPNQQRFDSYKAIFCDKMPPKSSGSRPEAAPTYVKSQNDYCLINLYRVPSMRPTAMLSFCHREKSNPRQKRVLASKNQKLCRSR